MHNPCVSSQLQQRPGLLAPRALAGGWRGAEARVMWAAMACWYSAAQQRMLFRGLVLGALLLRSFSRLHSSQHVVHSAQQQHAEHFSSEKRPSAAAEHG